jgi:hypothetical protein
MAMFNSKLLNYQRVPINESIVSIDIEDSSPRTARGFPGQERCGVMHRLHKKHHHKRTPIVPKLLESPQ